MIPVLWLSLHDEPARGYWCQEMLERLFDGRGWPVRGFDFHSIESFDELTTVVTERPTMEAPTLLRGAIVVIPGDYHEHDAERINALIAPLEWVLMIVTGDEVQRFPVNEIKHPNIRFWMQFGRPEMRYPPETRFIPCGYSPGTPDVLHAFSDAVRERPLDWFFAGQMVKNERRTEFGAHVADVPNGEFVGTEGFTQGLSRGEYLIKMRSAKIIPCPSGIGSQDSFRAYEALEAGCVPLLDGHRPLMRGEGFWRQMFGNNVPLQIVSQSWGAVSVYIRELLEEGMRRTNATFAWWQQYKRQMALMLHDDLIALGARPTLRSNGRDDEITVLVSCSPIPSHPSTEILDETIASIRGQLPRAEIMLMFDGVRAEQEDRRDDYEEHVNRVLHKCNSEWTNVVPFTSWFHLHQGLMTRLTMDEVRTPTILFVEQDTPMEGEIPWAEVVDVVSSRMLNVVRFHFEDVIPFEHDYLMLDIGPVDIGGVPIRRTAQWSQRPHLASSHFYSSILYRYIGGSSRTYIEDAVYGPCEESLDSRSAWAEWRVGIYHPEGGIRRSLHTDGRAGDTKWDPKFAYDGDTPPRRSATVWRCLMRWGLIGRPETDRGLGIQTREIARHLRPDWTLLLDLNSGFNKDFATFVDNPMTVMTPKLDNAGNPLLDLQTIERMLRTHRIEALLTVESFYDERLFDLCRRMKVKTINQMNPEFYRGHRNHPDEWWWPTPWMTHRLPIGKLMPVPVPWLWPVEAENDMPLTVLHVAGKRAVGDRNGTRLFIESLRYLGSDIEVLVTAQDHHDRWRAMIDEHAPQRGNVRVTFQKASMSDRKELYVGQDLLVMPRRFGGLCLTAIEAMGSGMAVTMPACSPNEFWPIYPMECDRDAAVTVPFGNIPTMTVQPEVIAGTIEMFATNRNELRAKQAEARAWAEQNTWEVLGPQYLERIQKVIG